MTNKKKLIPEPPRELVILDEDLRKKLQTWVDYFKAVSPHIRVISYLDKDFDKQKTMDIILTVFKEHHGFDAEISGLQPNDIAMVVCPPHSLVAEKKKYHNKNIFVFCFRDRAFDPEYEARNGDSEDEERADPENRTKEVWWRIQSPNYYSWNDGKDDFLGQFKELLKEVPNPPED